MKIDITEKTGIFVCCNWFNIIKVWVLSSSILQTPPSILSIRKVEWGGRGGGNEAQFMPNQSNQQAF